MIEKALKYLTEKLAQPELHETEYGLYSSKPMYRICHDPKAEPLKLTTLTSLVEYIRCRVDPIDKPQIIHIESPTVVNMYSILDFERQRECVVIVKAEVPRFEFNVFHTHEPFLINLQSKFIDCEDRALLLKFAGTVEAGSVAEYGDDGVTQKATVKTGIASKGDAIIPSPVLLRPYRTFVEVEQPDSRFVFRMKQDKYDGISCGLFEADGGAWKMQAIHNIKKYLMEQLKDVEGFIILA